MVLDYTLHRSETVTLTVQYKAPILAWDIQGFTVMCMWLDDAWEVHIDTAYGRTKVASLSMLRDLIDTIIFILKTDLDALKCVRLVCNTDHPRARFCIISKAVRHCVDHHGTPLSMVHFDKHRGADGVDYSGWIISDVL